MELISCPKHSKPCSLKTGTKPGPNKGKSFYLCMDNSDGQCDFVQQTSLPPKCCPNHAGEFVELQRVVVGKQSAEKRCYYRCADGRSNKTWCGCFNFTTQSNAALKDYNYQDRDRSAEKEGDGSSKQTETSTNSKTSTSNSSLADTDKEASVLNCLEKNSERTSRSESSSKSDEGAESGSRKHSKSDGKLQADVKQKEAGITQKGVDVKEKGADVKEKGADVKEKGADFKEKGAKVKQKEVGNKEKRGENQDKVEPEVVVLDSSDDDDDDDLPSFHSLAKRTPKSKAMSVEGNSSFTSYRDREVEGSHRSGQTKSTGPTAEVTKEQSPVDSLSNEVKKMGLGQGEDNPFLDLTLEQAISRKRDLLQALHKNKEIARRVKLSNLPDGGVKLTQVIETLSTSVRELDERIAKGIIPSVDVDKGPRVVPPVTQVMTVPTGQANGPQVIKVMPDGSKVVMTSQGSTGPRQTSLLQHAVQIPPHVLQQMYATNPQAMQLYGGRMTGARLREVSSITKEALEKLHKQLESCPSESEELEDPRGLTVPLMIHQRQALAWLSWREKQTPCGGILADDMGLGKTLTMISHIVKQREMLESGTDEEKSAWLNRDKELEKLDASVVPSRATLVVCPASLIYQWQKEIEKRTRPGLLKVEVYHGANRERNILKLAKNDVVLTTYNIVSKEVGVVKGESADEPVTDDKKDSEEKTGPQPMMLRIGWERIILDEGHNIKNHKSLTAMSVSKLRANFRWALTGTPIQNDLLDMYSLLRFLRCSPFDEYKVWKKHVDTGKSQGTTKLNTIVRSLLLRRTKNQTGKEGKPLVNLPTKSVETSEVQLTPEERKIYDKVFAQTKSTVQDYVKRHEEKEMGISRGTSESSSSSNPFRDSSSQSGRGGAWTSHGAGFDNVPQPQGKKAGASELLVLLLRLRQCCCHLSLMRDHIEQETMENEGIELTLEEQMKGMMLEEMSAGEDGAKAGSSPLFEKSASSTKLKELMSTLQTIKKESKPRSVIKSVVVSQWTKMLDIVAVHLRRVNITYNVIQGSIPAKKRIDMVEDFNTNPKGAEVMLVSLKAGGVGLNLIGGSHLFLLDNHWNPALEEQACDRIYRVGQKRDVVIHRFLCKDTIEEKILELQKRKLSLAKNVLSGSGASSQKLTLADLRQMFNV
ncbi:transcription termination factor 2-like [Haliotis cracherodii]|uniref:transcription termination factor 2-like n=1 Tax=Haliotis cracherodii TaxID=6455 RepID=UPI0039E90CA3